MVNVIKASGQREPFDENKLRESIKRAGIDQNQQETILKQIKTKLHEDIPTSEIYKNVLNSFDRSDLLYGKSRYSLKQSIMALGPSGYPFEDFFSEVLKVQAYSTQTRKIVTGKAVDHEIDIIAKKEEVKAMIECKFHNSVGIKTDIKVALYIKARFDDVKDLNDFNQAWLVTNTKVTNEVIDYASYYQLKAISWNYPNGESLRDKIEKYHLFPVTTLSTLSQNQKQKLLLKHVVLCSDLYRSGDYLNLLEISQTQKEKVMDELMFILNISKEKNSPVEPQFSEVIAKI